MRRVLVQRLRSAAVLAEDLVDGTGRVLLRRGQRLEPAALSRLARLGVSELLIEDERLADLTLRPLLPPAGAAAVVAAVSALYDRARAMGPRESRYIGWQGELAEASQVLVEHVSVAPGPFERVNVVAPDYLIGHALNVALLAVLMARRRGIAASERLVMVAAGALVADLGMVHVPRAELERPGPLSPAGLAAVRAHPERSFKALAASVPALVKAIVLSHHQRWDGSGYPEGRGPGELHPMAELVGAVDVFLALCEDRPHRRALPPHEALEYMMSEAGRLFSADVIDALARVANPYPTGVRVRLTSGEVGVVVRTGAVASRPVVRIIEDASGRRTEPYDLDLGAPEAQTIFVAELLYD